MTNLASVSIIFSKTLLGSIALGADVAAAQILKRHLVCIDVAAVNADVSSKFLLAVGELAAEPSRRWLLVQFLDIHWALTPHLHHKAGGWATRYGPSEALGKHRYSCDREEQQCKHVKQSGLPDSNSWCCWVLHMQCWLLNELYTVVNQSACC